MFENNEINAIINEIKKNLNIYEINLKDITNILFLLEWNFINKTEYRLFNIKWKNETSENINIIRNFLLEHEIELKQEIRFAEDVILELIKDAEGFPYFVHLLGKER